jgi:hypothetical protein
MKLFKWYKNKTYSAPGIRSDEDAYYIIIKSEPRDFNYSDNNFLRLFKHKWSYELMSFQEPSKTQEHGPKQIKWPSNITEQDYRSLIVELFEKIKWT